MAIPTLAVADAWFEPIAGIPRLTIATIQLGAPGEFWATLGVALVLFRHVADIKRQRVYAATEWGHDPCTGQPA